MHLSTATYRSQRFQIPLELELLMVKSHLVRMLGTELGPFVKVVCTGHY